MSDLDLQGGSLWCVLSIEEELLKKIFKELDAISLKNVELTSFFFRNFIQEASIWRKKFEKDHPNYHTELNANTCSSAFFKGDIVQYYHSHYF